MSRSIVDYQSDIPPDDGETLAEAFCPGCHRGRATGEHAKFWKRTWLNRMPRFIRELLRFSPVKIRYPNDAIAWYQEMRQGTHPVTKESRIFRDFHDEWHGAATDSAVQDWREAIKNGRNLADRQPEIIARVGGATAMARRISVALLSDRSLSPGERDRLERDRAILFAMGRDRWNRSWMAVTVTIAMGALLISIYSLALGWLQICQGGAEILPWFPC